MPRIKVNVTAELIARATQLDSRHCMIAEAIQADNDSFRNISVDLQTIRWTNRRGDRCIALTPETAATALVEFDQGRAVDPFHFTCETVQVTKPRKTTETAAETRAAGRTTPTRSSQGRGRKKLTVQADGTRPLINGGLPLPEGHLIGHAVENDRRARERDWRIERKERAKAAEEEAARDAGLFPADVPEGASNVRRSQPRYRQFGRRILKP